MDSTTTKTVLMLVARRAVSALGVFLVAHAMLASSDQSSFVEIMSGIVVSGAEFAFEWWRKTGMVLVSTRIAKLKGIPLPNQLPTLAVPPNGGTVEVKSKAA